MRQPATWVLSCMLPALLSCAASGPAGTQASLPVAAGTMSAGQLLELSATGDAARGEIAFEVCQGCHRRGGAGRPNGSYPRLAGQHASVLVKQLHDIQTGRRTNHKMLPFADESVLGPQQIADVAAYLQAQPPRTDNGKGPGKDLDQASQVYAASCARCHGERGQGDAAQFVPRLAGQHYLYLLREVTAIRDGQRGNSSPEMIDALRRHSAVELDAACDFASRLALD